MSRQLATSSENLVASAQFLVALATSELQFRTLRVERSAHLAVSSFEIQYTHKFSIKTEANFTYPATKALFHLLYSTRANG